MSVPRSSAAAAHEAVPDAPTPPPLPYADDTARARALDAVREREPAVREREPERETDRERELAAALLELAGAHGASPAGGADAPHEATREDGAHAGRESAPGGCHPLLAALADRAARRLARDGRRGETTVLLVPSAARGPAPHGHSGAHAAVLWQAEHELGEGPATDTLRTGTRVPWLLLEGADAARWPRYGPVAREAGVRAVLTVPLHGEGVTGGSAHRSATDGPQAPTGVLAVHLHDDGPLDAATHAALGSLAEACALGLAHQAALRRAEELQRALSSRIVLEQAKGMLAERRHSTPEEAFRTLRAYARSHRRALHQVARDLVEARLVGPPFEPFDPFDRDPNR
ncbi:ANTAR domain-containing protein [Streptomyces tubbatahanensis]|uniref:ANTAR domain-containing protein n=1 Tax=Streptomyces tubbatahanensis TaxID=2923272 RepID=A0ABY3XWL9_9ACTN|nr:ANTAR domain-containing protein [Streptomyces tubbatahanensis]UNS98891.1 ANTAR domain-containing protein [Streptomyces tubbatahanensis]